MTPTVLIVCTGNICRSPYAAAVLQAAFAADECQITSAGTAALSGHAADPSTVEVLERRGISARPFAASQLDAARIAEAHVVLTMTRAQRQWVLELAPLALRKAFTFTEFASIAHAIAPDLAEAPPGEVIPMIYRSRTRLARFVHSVDADIADPYGESVEAFESMASDIDRSAPDVISALRRLRG